MEAEGTIRAPEDYVDMNFIDSQGNSITYENIRFGGIETNYNTGFMSFTANDAIRIMNLRQFKSVTIMKSNTLNKS